MSKALNFWDKSERFTPCLCRLLARRSPGGPALSNDELAERSGLPVYEVVAISQQLDWKGVDLPTMQRFIRACGVDFEDPTTYRRLVVYLKGYEKKGGLRIAPSFSHLRRHPDWEQFFKPLSIKLLRNGKVQNTKG
jgi:hypothetical protein